MGKSYGQVANIQERGHVGMVSAAVVGRVSQHLIDARRSIDWMWLLPQDQGQAVFATSYYDYFCVRALG